MNRQIYEEMLADLLMEEVGSQVIDEVAATEISAPLAAFIGEPVSTPQRPLVGLSGLDNSVMWGRPTLH